MKSKTYILSLLIAFSSYSFACDCAIMKLSELQKSSYEYSDCIFIGEIVEIDNANYSFTIKVIESLDGGDKPGNLYVVKQESSCDIFTDKKEKWLVYADSHDEGFITMDMCALNRSFEKPLTRTITLPPMPVNTLTESEREVIAKKKWDSLIHREKKILEKEIEILREKRDGNASI